MRKINQHFVHIRLISSSKNQGSNLNFKGNFIYNFQGSFSVLMVSK